MKNRCQGNRAKQQAAALIMVLAFVVLLTAVVVATLTRVTTDRQISHSSLNQAEADQLALSATDQVISDLKQEIINGSTNPAPVVNGAPIYYPTSSPNIMPARSGNPPLVAGVDPIPNLIRISNHNDPTGTQLVKSRASSLSSITQSANGRYVSAARWNKHYLIPRDPALYGGASANNIGTDPVPSFVAPDWVFVTNQGPTALSAPDSTTIGRYAFAIYDEGGLLDVNAAGYPSTADITQYGRKGSLAWADLTSTGGVNLPSTKVDDLIGWRNYATAQPSSGSFSADFAFDANGATRYFSYIAAITTGFLAVNNTSWNSRTDQAVLSRQELINLRSSLGAGSGFSQDALQYLTHFSREYNANAPTWAPTVVTATNPNLQQLVVTSNFTRNDGTTTATVGEPLINKRFLLQRLNWLTYRGPSQPRNGIGNASALDPDMSLLINRFGLTKTFLQLGTAANIKKYFGLAWDGTNERWNYIGHANGNPPLQSSIAVLGSLTGSREPDFLNFSKQEPLVPP